MTDLKCDFCSRTLANWRYPASDFVVPVTGSLGGGSLGDWAACHACRELIEAGDREGLAERSIRTLIEIHPEVAGLRRELKEQIAGLQARFFQARIGPAVAERAR